MALIQHPTNERLQDIERRVRAALTSSACGPLVVAKEIVELAASWDEYKQEADGLSCTAWLRKTQGPGRGLAWFAMRHDAVLALGEDVRRTFHHDVAVWVYRNVPEDKRQAVKGAIQWAWAKQYKVPLTLQQARPMAWRVMGRTAKLPAPCARCGVLEELLRAAGIEVPLE